MSVPMPPMFSSAPARMYSGAGWEAKLPVPVETWCPVVLILPTNESADLLIALTGSEPRWYRGLEIRRIGGSSDAPSAVS